VLGGWRDRTLTARTSHDTAREIPEATVARLPVYLRALTTLSEAGTATCSSEDLAAAAGSSPPLGADAAGTGGAAGDTGPDADAPDAAGDGSPFETR